VGAFPLYTPTSKQVEPSLPSSPSSASSKPIPHEYWMEIPGHTGLMVCLTAKANFAIALHIKKEEIHVQNLRPSSRSTIKVEGMCVVTQSVGAPSLLILMDDGSLYRYEVTLSSIDKSKQTTAGEIPALINKKKQLGLQQKKTPDLTFFENVECITPSVTFAGDALQHYTSDQIKQRLASNEDYIVAPNKQEALKLVVQNPNHHDTVMVGVRVLLGNASLEHIPQQLRIFDNVIQVNDAARYNRSFTV
jgi:hypothetical protein